MTVRPTVRALRLSLAPHRVAVNLAVGRFSDEVRYGGRFSALQLTELPRPERPTGWVRIAPILAGICGSDQKVLTVTGFGPVMLALNGVPTKGVVPGHEIVGTVLEADDDAGVAVGDRVVADPLLPCAVKGFVPCDRCRAGQEQRCAHLADHGTLARGLGFGFNARYGGGWATELVAPASRVHRVPDGLDDRTAVLTEPTAVGVHAVLSAPPPPGARVLVFGPGSIGLTLVHALRALTDDLHVTVASLDHRTDPLAEAAGADDLVHGTRRPLVEACGRLLDSTIRGNRLSGPVLEDGFDIVYDTVGSEQTTDDAIRMVRPGGRIVMLATPTRQQIDWSLIWNREIEVRGSSYYSQETVPDRGSVAPGRRHGIDVAMDVLVERAPGDLVTHVFPLDESVEALATAAAGPGAGAVKVTFAPQG